jgi:hypothetical protein
MRLVVLRLPIIKNLAMMPLNAYHKCGNDAFEFDAFHSRTVSYEATIKNSATMLSNAYYESGREVPEFEAFTMTGTLGIALGLS